MYWRLGVCENIDTPTCISPYLISGISSSLPLDVGQKSNHVNLWYSLFVCLFIFSVWVCFVPIIYFLEIFLQS